MYDFLFGDAGKTISEHNRYVPKVSQRMQSLNPMFGVIAMSMALLKEEEQYRVGLGRMFEQKSMNRNGPCTDEVQLNCTRLMLRNSVDVV